VCDVRHIVYSQYFILVIAKRFILYYPVWAAIFRKNTLVDSTYKRAPALKPYGLRLPFKRDQISNPRTSSEYCELYGNVDGSYRVHVRALLRGMAGLLLRYWVNLLKLSSRHQHLPTPTGTPTPTVTPTPTPTACTNQPTTPTNQRQDMKPTNGRHSHHDPTNRTSSTANNYQHLNPQPLKLSSGGSDLSHDLPLAKGKT